MNDKPNQSHPHSHPEKKDQPPVPPAQPQGVEDAGSHALSEALRSSFIIVKIIMIILVVVFFASGFFTVSSQERAIVLRFGKPVGTGEDQLLGPGAHWSFPYPIDEIVRIPYSQFQTVRSTAGWYATTPEAEATNSEPEPGPSLNPAADGYTLTSDTNIIHIRATLRYRINNPIDYALKFVNASNLVQNALDNALFHASAQFSVDDALRLNQTGLKEKLMQRVRQLVDQHGLGVTVEQLDMETRAPRFVRRSFEDVLAADQIRRQTNEVALSYANRVQSTAQGDANALINSGYTDRERMIQEIAAEAKYFTNQLPQFQKDPELFIARLRIETIRRILTNSAVEKFPITRKANRGTELRINLSREPQKPVSTTPGR